MKVYNYGLPVNISITNSIWQAIRFTSLPKVQPGINIHQKLLTQRPFLWLHPMIPMELQPPQYEFVSLCYCNNIHPCSYESHYSLGIHLKGWNGMMTWSTKLNMYNSGGLHRCLKKNVISYNNTDFLWSNIITSVNKSSQLHILLMQFDIYRLNITVHIYVLVSSICSCVS